MRTSRIARLGACTAVATLAVTGWLAEGERLQRPQAPDPRRLAVVQAIAPHRRRVLHGRLLAILQDAGNVDPAVLAHHAEAAGDAVAIRRHARNAARRSAELGAHREAALRAALHLQRELGDDLGTGEDLSALSDVLCYQCRGEESSRAAGESLAVVRSLPPGRS